MSGPHVSARAFADMAEVILARIPAEYGRALQVGESRAWSYDHFFEKLSWRHHALGMLQAELSESVRIHVWDTELVRFADGAPRAIHDHRFDLLSYVAAGELTDVHVNVRFTSERPSRPGWDFDPADWTPTKAWSIRHAKIQAHDRSDFGEIGPCFYREGVRRVFGAGEVYHIPRRAFHTTTRANAVTIVHRSNFDSEPARVLGELDSATDGHEPITGIIRSTPQSQIQSVLWRAARLLAFRALPKGERT